MTHKKSTAREIVEINAILSAALPIEQIKPRHKSAIVAQTMNRKIIEDNIGGSPEA